MKLSVISVSYNSASTIRDTLNCIASQNFPEIEHIIIDGGSTDGTLEIINEFPHVAKLVSEADNGLYDAMNKGIRMATGDVIGILNSDDVYAKSDILSKVAQRFEDENISVTYGDLQYVAATDMKKVVRTWRAGNFKPLYLYYGWMPPHPTFFVRKEVYSLVGLFNTSLKNAADYELMLRILLKYRLNPTYIPDILVKMRVGGVSNSSFTRRIQANLEDRTAWKMNNLKPYFFTLYLKPLRKLSQFFFK